MNDIIKPQIAKAMADTPLGIVLSDGFNQLRNPNRFEDELIQIAGSEFDVYVDYRKGTD